MTRLALGRWILRVVAFMTIIGGFVADWNRTHLFNPSWPPHAKFHDAMTICLGVFLGALSLMLSSGEAERSRRDLRLCALLPALFYAAQAASFAFPNTGGLETEFPDLIPRVAGVPLNEMVFALGMLALSAVGFVLARGAEPKPATAHAGVTDSAVPLEHAATTRR